MKGQNAVKVLPAGTNGIRVIGPDGKELKDVRIIIGDATNTTAKPLGDPVKVVKPLPAEQPAKVLKASPAGQPGKGVMLWENLPKAPKAAFSLEGAALSLEGNALWYSHLDKIKTAENTITLSRATYKVGKDQAAALSALLGSIKATVMETKVEGDAVIVTTTPEAQAAIGQIVKLMQGTEDIKVDLKFTPATPAKPADPVKPGTKVPADPAKPADAKKPQAFFNYFDVTKTGDEQAELKLMIEKYLNKIKEAKEKK